MPGARRGERLKSLADELTVLGGRALAAATKVIRPKIISPGAVATELPDSITGPEAAERTHKFYKDIAIPGDSCTRAAAFAIGQPEDVDVSEILFPPHTS
jgi:NADP-dependent 3-hydroxy acid dehydrogenase YdfG